MDRQAEYLIARNQVPRGQITTRFFTLGAFLVLWYLAIWYFWPTSNLANFPYCIGDLVSGYSSEGGQQATLSGVYISPRTGPRMDNFDLPWVHLLRFASDGQVMFARETYISYINWRDTLKWFRWGTTDNRVFMGSYEIINDQIQITLGRQPDNYFIEWEGTIADGKLIFEGNDYLIPGPFANTNSIVFTHYLLEQCPFGNE